MAKTAKVKCKFCKKQVNKDIAVAYALGNISWYFCNEDHMEQFTMTDEYDELMLIDDIYNLSDKQCDIPWLKKQIEFYHNEYNLTYLGMRLAVVYFTEIDNQTWNNEYGLGQIIPKYYDLAKKHHQQCEEIRQMCEDLEEDECVVVEHNEFKKPKHIIDISNL